MCLQVRELRVCIQEEARMRVVWVLTPKSGACLCPWTRSLWWRPRGSRAALCEWTKGLGQRVTQGATAGWDQKVFLKNSQPSVKRGLVTKTNLRHHHLDSVHNLCHSQNKIAWFVYTQHYRARSSCSSHYSAKISLPSEAPGWSSAQNVLDASFPFLPRKLSRTQGLWLSHTCEVPVCIKLHLIFSCTCVSRWLDYSTSQKNQGRGGRSFPVPHRAVSSGFTSFSTFASAEVWRVSNT